MRPIRRIAAFAALLFLSAAAQAATVFINELHYDNAGSDVGEGVEIAGTAGTDLTGYGLYFYNGSNGAVYESLLLTGLIDNEQDGVGAVFFEIAGLQNGGPDGVALVDAAGTVVQFLSYEGSFGAKAGPAAGLMSSDIGVEEDGSGDVGMSLQLTGIGSSYAEFTWVAAASSYGQLNVGQSVGAPVPLPGGLALLASALASLGMRGGRR